MKESFSSETKRELYTHFSKNKCCNLAELSGLFLYAPKDGTRYKLKCDSEELALLVVEHLVPPKRAEDVVYDGKYLYVSEGLLCGADTLTVERRVLKCEHCLGAFLRGVFLARGRITDPGKAYHMELVFKQEDARDSMGRMLQSMGQEMKPSRRKGDFLLYRKGSETIEDFLALIGSNKMLFEFMNRKIVKDVRNNANRAANCDAGNIRKSLEASKRQIEAVRLLIESGKIETLSEELKATAYLRLENESLSLEDLALKMSPPISKSGLNHRLEKIIRVAEGK